LKPPTPGLLLVNKQIYHESVAILYSSNIFKFQEAGHLFALEQQIGLHNCERVRNMLIWVRFPRSDEAVRDPRLLLKSEYDSAPSHWIAGLNACSLREIKHLAIEGETILSPATYLLLMPTDLQQCIEQFLGRAADNTVPHLLLRGFCEEEREKFPERWEVVVDQWDSYKEEAEEPEELGTMEEMEGIAASSDPKLFLTLGFHGWKGFES
jgi:hypothetical protein